MSSAINNNIPARCVTLYAAPDDNAPNAYPLPPRFCGPGFRSLTRKEWYELCLVLCVNNEAEIIPHIVQDLELDVLEFTAPSHVLAESDHGGFRDDAHFWGVGAHHYGDQAHKNPDPNVHNFDPKGSYRVGYWRPLVINGFLPDWKRIIGFHSDVIGGARAYGSLQGTKPEMFSNLYGRGALFGYSADHGRIRIPQRIWEKYFPENAQQSNVVEADAQTPESSRLLSFFGSKAPEVCPERNGFYDRYDD